jgi:hypothetical protein
VEQGTSGKAWGQLAVYERAFFRSPVMQGWSDGEAKVRNVSPFQGWRDRWLGVVPASGT